MQASSVSAHALFYPNSAHTHPTTQFAAFPGVSFKLKPTLRSFTLSRGARRSLTIVAATKKAVAVLKGNSNVEGVVTLTQEEGGLYLHFNLDFVYLAIWRGTVSMFIRPEISSLKQNLEKSSSCGFDQKLKLSRLGDSEVKRLKGGGIK